MYYSTWGDETTEIGYNIIKINKIKIDSNISFITVTTDSDYKTRVTLNYEAGNTVNFIDFKQPNGSYCRIINNGLKYYFDDHSNPYFYFESTKSNNLIHKVKPASKYEFNVGTLDLETFIEINEHKILCACFYDGKDNSVGFICDRPYRNIWPKNQFDSLKDIIKFIIAFVNSYLYFNSKVEVLSIELLVNGVKNSDNLPFDKQIDAYFKINRKEKDRPYVMFSGKPYPK